MSEGTYDPVNNPYADVPKRMRDLEQWLPSTDVVKRALAGHELFGLKDQPMTPRHKVFIALAYAYTRGRVEAVDKPVLHCWFDFGDGHTCMLPRDHSEEHEPVPDGEIGVSIAPTRDTG